MTDLTSTVGIVSLVAGGIALIALVLAAVVSLKLRHVRRAQKMILGDGDEHDIVDHARRLQIDHDRLTASVSELATELDNRSAEAAERLDRAISHAAVIRYDAYGEMSGRQSTSIALLDPEATGIVLSSILHRDQARLYAKHLSKGRCEIELSPEEKEAVKSALEGSISGTGNTQPEDNRATG